jgi:hypothetical protein
MPRREEGKDIEIQEEIPSPSTEGPGGADKGGYFRPTLKKTE